jgi:hypothetical protein
MEVTHYHPFEISRLDAPLVKLLQNSILMLYREFTKKAVEDSKSWEVSDVIAARRLSSIE